MSEVEAGIAPLGEKIKSFLAELFIDVEMVEKKHKSYMEFKKQQCRADAQRAARGEAQQ
jgi:hypothetical protein